MAGVNASISESMRANLIHFDFLVLTRKVYHVESLIDSVFFFFKAKPLSYFQVKHHKK